MQPAIIITMDEEREQKEARYLSSIDDMKLMRKELNLQSASIGRIEEAFTGNKIGTPGLVNVVDQIKMDQTLMSKRLQILEEKVFEMQVEQKSRNKMLSLVWALVASICTIVIKSLFDKFSKK